MRRTIQLAAAGVSVLFPLWLLGQPAGTPSGSPSTAPAPASRPSGVPLSQEEKTGRLMIGKPPAIFMQELFVYNGKKTSPAPAEVSVTDSIKLPGFSGKYPVAVAAGLSPPVAGKAWAVLAGVQLDASDIDRSKMKVLTLWQVLSAKGELIGAVSLNLMEESFFFISPQYVVYAYNNRKIAENGPFASFIFPGAAVNVTVSRNGTKVEAGITEGSNSVMYRFEKLNRTDLIEWEIAGPKPYKGSLRPLLLSAEDGFVEYSILNPADLPATRPATR